VLSAEPRLEPVEGQATRPTTKFELRGLKLGHKVLDLVYRKRP
jgi:tRNA G46 methylase TrmB